jgi:cbb3-type cytochrome oxidase subunit 1
MSTNSATHHRVAAVAIIGGIVVMVVGYFLAERMTYPKVKTEADCTTTKLCPVPTAGAYGASNVGCCAIWSNKVCRKGKLDKDKQTCVAETSIWPMLFGIGGLGLVAYGIYLFVKKPAK